MNRIDALRRERADVLTACRKFSDSEWKTPSAASGWQVQTVIAHMGSAFHAMFSPVCVLPPWSSRSGQPDARPGGVAM